MRWLSFLSRVAFIGNLFFLLTLLLRWKNFIRDEATTSFIIILGYTLTVFVINPITNLLYFATLAIRKKLFDVVPKWLVIANFIFLLLQLVFLLYILNDTLPS